MPRKIFISYRREDSAASAISIGQYLENEFGRKNVFLDIDMRAGTLFPAVLEQRLAECKVMLVLIGPSWLNAKDEEGRRRLDNPHDWVRLEIERALRRKITVIPVRLNGAELPARAMLPNDIEGLLDHQAASVTLSGFRHEMAGLVRDIRSIPSPPSWQRFGSVAGALVLSALVLALAQSFWFPSFLERVGLAPGKPGSASQAAVWNSKPGEWVLYATSAQGSAYYFEPSSIKTFGDAVAYTARYALNFDSSGSSGAANRAAFEDDRTVLSCKNSLGLLAERTIYNVSGEIISHYKRGNPKELDLAAGEKPSPGSILATAQNIMCSEQLRTPLLSKEQLADLKLKYLTFAPNGDGDMFYGLVKTISDSGYSLELLLVIRFQKIHGLSELFPAQKIVGIPFSARTLVDLVNVNCAEQKKVIVPKFEYFDPEGNLAYVVAASTPAQPLDVKDASPFAQLVSEVCGPNVGGVYEGTNNTTYKAGGEAEQKITITTVQTGDNLKVSFVTASGGQGQGDGRLTGNRAQSISLRNTNSRMSGRIQCVIRIQRRYR